MTLPTHLRGIALAMGSGICWGSMAVAAQYLMVSAGFEAMDLVTSRLLGAGLMLLLLDAFLFRQPVFSYCRNRGDFLGMMIYGFLLMATQLAFFLAIETSNAGTAAIFVMTGPAFILLWESLVGRCFPSARALLAVLLAMAGVSLIVTKGDFSHMDFNLESVGWGLTSAIAGSAASIQPRRLLNTIPVTVVVAFGMTAGGLMMCFVAPPWAMDADWTALSVFSYGYMVIFGTLIAFILYLSSLKYISPTAAGLVNSFEPLSAVFFSVVLLGVTVTVPELIGGALVFVMLWLLTTSPKKSA